MRMPVILCCTLLASVVAGAQTAGTSGSGGREAFTAVALSAGGPRTNPVATQLDIVIDRWSTEAERLRLLEALKDGQTALLDRLRDLPRVGHIKTPGNLGWDLHYAHQVRGGD